MPCRLPHSRSQAGFSLIFVSVLLTVAAIVVVSFLPGKEAGDRLHKSSASVKTLQRVEEAMRGFMARYGRRPCPAQGRISRATPISGWKGYARHLPGRRPRPTRRWGRIPATRPATA